jgi:hypothetical protein
MDERAQTCFAQALDDAGLPRDAKLRAMLKQVIRCQAWGRANSCTRLSHLRGQDCGLLGHFVLGYPFGNSQDGSRQDARPLPRPWFKNGSYLVFRRLNQNVAGFAASGRQKRLRHPVAHDQGQGPNGTILFTHES